MKGLDRIGTLLQRTERIADGSLRAEIRAGLAVVREDLLAAHEQLRRSRAEIDDLKSTPSATQRCGNDRTVLVYDPPI